VWQLERAVRVPLLLVAVCAASGCDRIKETISTKVQEEVEQRVHARGTDMPGTLATPALTDEERLADKLVLYHECMRRARGRIGESWRRWGEGVDLRTGMPKSKSAKPLVPVVDTELLPCKRAAEEGPQTEPQLVDIERAFADWYAAALAFAKHTRELDEYYADEGYKEDQWAKGKEIAPAFVAAHAAWETADIALGDLLEREQDQIDERLLAQIETRDGKKARWLAQRITIAAKAYARCARRGNAGECDEQRVALESSRAELDHYRDAHETEVDHVFWMSSFRTATTRLIDDGAALATALSAKKPKGEDERARVAASYDELVTAHDNLRFGLP
jgi:hypothetical protein